MTPCLELDPQTFTDHFGGEPFMLRHHLAQHPLLQLDALAGLADELPEAQVEHNLGSVATVTDPSAVQRLDLTPGEIARGIEDNGCWMVLKNVETVAAYGALLDATLAEVMPYVPRREGAVSQREAFIFLSAAGSVTPVHIDPEHNMLLQTRGTKEMHIGRLGSPEDTQLELERFYSGGHRNVAHHPFDERTYELAPGDGVAVPLNAPHWVGNGPTVSISLSVTFRTKRGLRTGHLHRLNAELRARGRSPRGPHERALSDAMKIALLRTRGLAARAGVSRAQRT